MNRARTDKTLRRSSQEIPCAKCGEANPPGSNVCGKCEAHLWVACHHCGHRNRRIETRCVECEGRLHRSWWKRVSKKVFPRGQRIAAWQVALLAVAVWAAYRFVVYFSEYQAPPSE